MVASRIERAFGLSVLPGLPLADHHHDPEMKCLFFQVAISVEFSNVATSDQSIALIKPSVRDLNPCPPG